MKTIAIIIGLFVSVTSIAQFESHVITSQFDDANFGLLSDFDGDGDLDLVFTDDDLMIMFNLDGKGDFGSPIMISTVGGNFTKAVDADGDGDMDLLHFQSGDIMISYNSDGSGTTWENTIIKTFDQQGTYGFSYWEDIDGDGDFDAVSSALTWIENVDGNFTMGEEKEIYLLPQDHDVSRQIHPVDWDADGDFDVVINVGVDLNQSIVLWLRNDGSENFDPILLKDTIPSMDGLTFTELEDVDNDGDFDLVVHGGPNDIVWYKNIDGQLSDGILIHNYFDYPGDFALVDINGDNQLDVFWCGHGGKFWKENLGGFTFNDDVDQIGSGGVDATNDLAFGDVDGDDDVDIVTFGKSIGGFQQYIRWYENKLTIDVVESLLNETNPIIYPNPVLHMLHLDSPYVVECKIISLSGSLMKYSEAKSINVSSLDEGMYILQCKSSDRISQQIFYKANSAN